MTPEDIKKEEEKKKVEEYKKVEERTVDPYVPLKVPSVLEAWESKRGGSNEEAVDSGSKNENGSVEKIRTEKKIYHNRPAFAYDENKGPLSFLTPPTPKRRLSDEDMHKRTAKAHAMNDFFQALGSFAGGGLAPVERKKSNHAILTSLAEADRLKREYYDKKEAYDVNKFNLGMKDYYSQYDAYIKSAHEPDTIVTEKTATNKDTSHANKSHKVSQDGSDTSKNLAHERAMAKAKARAGKGPFTSVVRDNGRRVDVSEPQARQIVSIVEEKYKELQDVEDVDTLDDEQKAFVNSFDLLLKTLETGGDNDAAVKDFVADYLENHYDDVSYVFTETAKPEPKTKEKLIW